MPYAMTNAPGPFIYFFSQRNADFVYSFFPLSFCLLCMKRETPCGCAPRSEPVVSSLTHVAVASRVKSLSRARSSLVIHLSTNHKSPGAGPGAIRKKCVDNVPGVSCCLSPQREEVSPCFSPHPVLSPWSGTRVSEERLVALVSLI